jgi:hypothetical protein
MDGGQPQHDQNEGDLDRQDMPVRRVRERGPGHPAQHRVGDAGADQHGQSDPRREEVLAAHGRRQPRPLVGRHGTPQRGQHDGDEEELAANPEHGGEQVQPEHDCRRAHTSISQAAPA